MAEVILVYPNSSYIETAMKNQYLPLSLLQAAVFVEKEFTVKLIDQRLTKRWDKDLTRQLKKDTLCVCFTALTGEMINNALEISRFVKRVSRVPVVWGGIHPSILPEQTLRNKYVDIVVVGEGEATLYDLVKALKDKSPLPEVPGIAYKTDNGIKINQARPLVDLNSLPEPPYNLVDVENYITKFDGKNMFVLETSRGCPYRCAFCCNASFGLGSRWRALSPDKAIERMKSIKERFNIDGIEIVDDNFFIDSERAKAILRRVVEEKLNIFLNICGRINDVLRLDMGNLSLLEEAGVRRLAIGIESGSQRILDLIRKDTRVEEILDFKERIDKTRIPPFYCFIGGFPTETEEDLRRSADLMLKLLKGNRRAKVSIFHCLRPLPGTELTYAYIKGGLVMPSSLEDWGKYTLTYIDHPWLTNRLKRKIKMLNFVSLFLDNKYEEVSSLAVKLFARLYRPVAYLRVKTLSTFIFLEYIFLRLYERIRRFRVF
ncbi:MAG: B12-binding domain-containing radical SAM protein [Candidatus Omnitrophica bacterium]|nr:B12-binding domain-containing radical SAM protein [Candidatus Omnitrophota bacterium]